VVGEINHHGELVSAARDSYQRHDIGDNPSLYEDMIKE
jgi:hypothetical protein